MSTPDTEALLVAARTLAALLAAELAPLLAVASPPPVPALAPLVDKREIGRLLSVSPGQIDRLVRAGKIPVIIVGDVRRFDVAAVRAALDARTVEAPPELPASNDSTPASSGVRLLSRPSAGRRAAR